jgi:hypothetical protein
VTRWKDISKSIEGCQEALKELMSNIGRESIEVDVIDIEGPDFLKIDNRALALQLVEVGLTDAVLFDSQGQVLLLVTIQDRQLRVGAAIGGGRPHRRRPLRLPGPGITFGHYSR